MRIVQVISNVPFAYPLPPSDQGGTEKVVYDLTEELVRRGHKVYLYAAAGSSTNAKLIPFPAYVNEKRIAKYVARTRPRRVDIIHDHTFHSVISKRKRRIPTVATHHIPVNHKVKHAIYVSKRCLEAVGKNKGYFVYNGINPEEYEFSEEKSDYLLFIGRIVREKGILEAIDIANRTNHKLKIAGPIKDQALFDHEIAPHLEANPNIEYVGAVSGQQKQDLLKQARCLLFPTLWEEPFGLVMIEAMACGTPVIGLANGAVPEVLSGFPHLICHSVDEMVDKVLYEPLPEPHLLREYVSSQFSHHSMADRYEDIYRMVIRKARLAMIRRRRSLARRKQVQRARSASRSRNKSRSRSANRGPIKSHKKPLVKNVKKVRQSR